MCSVGGPVITQFSIHFASPFVYSLPVEIEPSVSTYRLAIECPSLL